MRQVSEQRISKLTHALVGMDSPSLSPCKLSDEEVLDLYELANRFWMGASFANALIARSDFADFSPEIIAYSKDLSSAAQKRNQLHKEQAIELVKFLNDREIEPLLIKGSAELFSSVDNPQGQRWMMDLDIVIPEDQVKPIWTELVDDLGYKPLYEDIIFDWKDPVWHHGPILISPSGVSIELHRSITSYNNLFFKSVNSDHIEPVKELFEQGLKAHQLDPTNKLILSISHDLISHEHFKNKIWDIRYSYNMYLLCKSYGEKIDWQTIDLIFDKYGDELEAAKAILSLYFDLPFAVDSKNILFKQFVDSAIQKCNRSSTEVEDQALGYAYSQKIFNYFSPKRVLAGLDQPRISQVFIRYFIKLIEIPKKLPFLSPKYRTTKVLRSAAKKYHPEMLDK